MSGAIASAFPSMNDLLGPQYLALRERQSDIDAQTAQLQQQTAQRQFDAADIEQAGRLAQFVLNQPDEASRASAYSSAVGQLPDYMRAHVPQQYPGAQTLQSFVSRAIPVPDQYKLGLATNPAFDADMKRFGLMPGGMGGGAGGAPAGNYGAGGPAASATVPQAYMPYFQEASARTGIPVDVLIAQARQESGFNPNATGSAGEIGLFQIKPSTAQAPGFGLDPVDPGTLRDPRSNILFGAQYLKARMGSGDPADPAVQRRGLAAYNGGGDPNYVANVTRYLPQPGGVQTADAAPPRGVAARTGGTDVAGPGAGPAPAPPTPLSMAPAGAPTGAAPDSTPADSALAPDVRQRLQAMAGPPPNALGPQNVAPAAATPAPAPAAAPQPAAPSGGYADTPPTPSGANSPQALRANEMLREAAWFESRYPGLPAAKAQADLLKAQAGQLLKMETWTPAVQNGVPGQRNSLSGEFKPDPARRITVRQDSSVIDDTGRTIAPALPVNSTPANASYDLNKRDYENDQKKADELSDQALSAQTAQTRIQQQRAIIDKITTGAFGGTRADLANFAETIGMPSVAKALIGNNSGSNDPAALAQEFTKLATGSAGDQDRQTMGSRAGVAALKIFMAANPNLGLRPDANKRILVSQLIGQQAAADYAQGGVAWAQEHGQRFVSNPGGGYQPLRAYDAQWNANRNPQKYAAAMSALAGDDFDTWTKGLSPEEAKDVTRIVYRADPTATIQGRGKGVMPVSRFVGAQQ